jgi:hypothetical protein
VAEAAAGTEDSKAAAANGGGGNGADAVPKPAASHPSIFGIERAPSAASTLRDGLVQALPAALKAVAVAVFSFGFVAAIGAFMLWVRFGSLGLPADQAIVVVPKQDLLAVGAILLLQYVGIGVAAVLLVRSRDPFGNASRATRRALADLLFAELLIAGAIVVRNTHDPHPWRQIVLPAVLLFIAWLSLRGSVRLSGTEGPRSAATKAEREAIRRAWWAQHYRRRLAATVERLKSFRDEKAPVPAPPAAAAPVPEAPGGDPSLADVIQWVESALGLGGPPDDVAAGEAQPAPFDPLEAELVSGVRTATREEAMYANGADAAERELVIRQVAAQKDPADESALWWWHGPHPLLRIVCRVVAVGTALGAGLLAPGPWLAWLVAGGAALALGRPGRRFRHLGHALLLDRCGAIRERSPLRLALHDPADQLLAEVPAGRTAPHAAQWRRLRRLRHRGVRGRDRSRSKRPLLLGALVQDRRQASGTIDLDSRKGGRGVGDHRAAPAGQVRSGQAEVQEGTKHDHARSEEQQDVPARPRGSS